MRPGSSFVTRFRHSAILVRVGTAICSALFLLCSAAAVRAQAPAETETELKQALALSDSGRWLEALPLFQHLAQLRPDDTVVKARLAFALVALSPTKTDPQEKRNLRLQARKLLLDAQALGDNGFMVRLGLDTIPEDGSAAPFADRDDVSSAMQAAEAAFAAGDFDAAAAGYLQALMLDPGHYEAALYLGDVYFRKKDMAAAVRWYSDAVSIDPDRETAYRYWGDALLQTGKRAEALNKFIEALVAEPYNSLSSGGLLGLAQSFQVTLRQPRIRTDAPAADAAGDSSPWASYQQTRALWRDKKFKEAFPNEKGYRHSLQEEAEALGAAALSAEQIQKSKAAEDLDPSLALLVKLKQDGLIESYVLISAADQDIAQDYPAYRAANRELIRRYIAEYIAAPLRARLP